MNLRQTSNRSPYLRALAFSAPALALALLTGCSGTGLGTGNFGLPTTAASKVSMLGNVHGGQSPVLGASMQLYAVGAGGIGSASTPLGTAGTTDAAGNFAINASSYDCTTVGANAQVYIVAANGDPSDGANSWNNTALRMVALIGPCHHAHDDAATIFLNINEVTTIASAYALAPFTSVTNDVTKIGAASVADTGMVNAFATAMELVSMSSGQASGFVAPGESLPTIGIYTLADVLVACVNTSGPSSTGCTTNSTATGGNDTFAQAVAIAKNPGASAITSLYTQVTGLSPYTPTYSSQPNDFTLAVKYTGGSTLATPYAVAIDGSGNAWVANASGSAVTELSPTGAVLATPTATNLYGAQGIAVDKLGNVWVANTAGNSVVKFTVTGGAITATNSFTTNVTAPAAIAIDSGNNAFVANLNSNSVTEFTNAGLASTPFTGSGNITVPSGIALDTSGNVLVTSGMGVVVKLNNTGTYVSSASDAALQGPVGLAVDSSNRVFATGSTTGATVTGAVGEYTAAGATSAASPVSMGLSVPFGVATDANSAWVANSTASGSLAQLQYNGASPLSPAAGFGTQNVVAGTAGSLNTPVGVAVDASGNVWTTNSGDNTISKFIGLAASVKTPIAVNVGP